MSKKKRKEQAPDNIEAVESVLSRSEQFIEDNQKKLTTVVLVIVAIVGIYLAYQKWYLKPLEEEANSQMFVAEQYFERDSFNLALNGDLNYPGFLEIIDDYSATSAANLANYYAGVSYLHLGQFEDAIEYLSDFDVDDETLKPMSLGGIGDAYMELKDTKKAIDYYIKAGTYNENEFVSPIYLLRAGQALESIDDYEGALKQYNLIKEKYKNSAEGRVIEKYIAKAELLAKK
jgi:tetratricopeptide (TPR) repeat protein